ncbi:hypothetical protein RRG08_041067 [Elysia crispata]|uniref:Gfo/Idh/MocA-like oxidoreductase N-terminal domain-containing protein n=1 Tax=Elysia crispata TaxID=231223 RepID=A0AAE0Y846_9GAST|nr:hypothetical protein RRG08_041067 [Elysia crispata]
MSKRTNYSNEADDACPLTCLVVGAGNRGSKYSVYATLFPSQMKVVGVAEPNQTRRDNLCKKVGTIGKEYMFSDWREAAEKKKFADFVIITTTDQHHRIQTSQKVGIYQFVSSKSPVDKSGEEIIF